MRIRPLSLPALVLSIASCSSTVDPDYRTGSLMVANASNGWIDVDIDGRRWVIGLSMNALTFSLSVPEGSHRVRLSHGSGIAGAIEVPVEVDMELPVTVVVHPTYPVGTSPDIVATVLTDTGAYVPGGKSKLRVANLAATAGDIQIWRRQPNSVSASPMATPIQYRAASPYLEGDAGVWEVWLTAPGGGAKLLSSGPIQIPSGERRTALLVDTQEGPRFVVMGL